MEDFGGISLENWQSQRENCNAIAEFLNIAIQLAEIFQQLHQNKIIHKDIKPANILINPETLQVKLIDFSNSSLLPKEAPTLQTPNVLEGTLAYLSPEQTGRMNRGIDYRSDFYSLGVTFYELLTGKLPFATADPLELIHCHIAKIPPLISHQLSVTSHQLPIPETLAKIVMKLMAKNAEDRYQSAFGLKCDLEKCRSQWQANETIEPFVLGERDLCDRFIIPEKLYGREKEVQLLLDAFARVTSPEEKRVASPPDPVGTLHATSLQTRTEMMLVTGYSGIGKTAIINEVRKPITRQQSYFIKGKFDQFNRNIPFSAFVQAFRSLMRQLLGESDRALARWKTVISEALGESGQVPIEVIPELERIIGSQPPVPELSGSAARDRFNLLFSRLIRAIATPAHPLVIFLDDLQWVDSASLSLLKLLMEEESGYLLVLGAYRDNEVFPAHSLMLTLEEICQQQAMVNTIALEPLREEDIDRLVSESLHCSVEIAQPLSRLVYQKTRGNPFFATQFLQGLYEDGWISFLPPQSSCNGRGNEGGYWQCDLNRVRQLALTDDVVAFMVGRLQKLPEETQNILKLAACMGNRFDLATLATVCEQNRAEVAANLWRSLQVGLVIPENETYKFFQGEKQAIEIEREINVNYRFLHDRVRQAAYALIPEREKQAKHWQIGQLLLKAIPVVKRRERILDLVRQLNMGSSLITPLEQRQELVDLNLIVSQKVLEKFVAGELKSYDLVAAEICRASGQKLEAIELYDKAIAEANANAYIQEESLANELAAQFYLDWEKEKIAAVYMQEAYDCYARWDAKAKVTDLETRYPHLLRSLPEPAAPKETLQALSAVGTPAISIHSSSSSSNIGETFDLADILKATQTLAEIAGADELLYRLTQIILQNSGGDRCALILPDEKGVWQVEAIATAEGVDLEGAPLEGHGNLPVRLIRYVKNAREILVIDNGETDLPVRDPCLLQQLPPSLLCLPLLHQGQLAGILYVSNQATAGVFTRDRLLVLNFLCTHAAISFENARLYRNLERQVEEQNAALQQSQYELSDYVENAAISLHWVDKDGTIVWANQTELDFLGYDREEYIGQPIAKFHADPEIIADILVRLANNETLANYEARLRCKDGSIRYVQINSNVFYRDGEFVHTRCFTTDVTKRKLLEREWRASQQRYATLADMLPTGIFLTDPQGHSRYNNPSCCQMLGLTPEEALGEGWSQTLHPDDREQVFQGWYQAVRDRQMPYQTDCRFLHRDGKVVWMSVQAVEEFDLEGNLTGYIGSLTDITERKAAETALNNLVEGTAATTGEDFFPALAHHISTALDVPIALVTQFVGSELQSIAAIVDGELQPNCTYNLSETPCIELTTQSSYYCPQGLSDRFPNNPHRAIGAESYLGVTLRDRQGQVLGSLCILDRQPLREPERARQILAIFASRTAAEMQRQRVETALQNLISGTAVTKGTEFFPVLVRYLTEALGVSHALMAERVGDREETLAYYGDGKLISCTSLSLLGTPCEEVYDRGAYYCELEPCQTCSELAAMGAKSYLGVALYDRQGNAMGLLCIFHRQILIDPVHAEQILRVFAARAATELERQHAQTALEQLNRELEQRVEERTRELVRSERDLQTIFNNACDGIIIHDLDGRVLDINHGALELFEATRGQILTTAMAELSAPDSSSEYLTKCFEQAVAGENLQFEWNHQRFDGSTFASEVSFRPVTLGNRQAIVAGIRDISDRKEAENALQEEQLRLKLALDAANMGTWSCSLDTGQLIWSDRAQEIFGFAPGTFSGDRDTFIDMVHPEDREEVLAAIAATFTTGAPYQLEYRIRRLDGEIRWLAVWGRTRPALPPLSPQLVGVVVDISDRKQAEIELQSVTDRLTLAMESGALGYWQWTRATNDVYWDDRAYKLHGVPKGNLNYEIFRAIVHPEDIVLLEDLMERALAGERYENAIGSTIPYKVLYRAIRPDGEIVFLQGCGKVLRDREGEATGMLGVVFDMTPLKRAEEQLQRQAREERLISVVLQRMRASLSLDEVLTTTLDELRNILHCDRVLACQSNNSEIRKVVAESVATGCASLMEDRFYQGVSCFSDLQRRFENGDTSAYVLNNLEDREIAPAFQDFCTRASVRAKIAVPIARNETLWGLLIVHQCDGARHWQPWEIDLLGRIANQLAIAIQQADLFERLQQELQERQTAQAKLTQSNQQLALSNRELARATRLKDEFLATMSHELRTPLNSILGMTESLQEGILGTVNTAQLHALDTIERSGNRLLNLINDILDLSKIAAEKMELSLEPTDVARLCYSCLPLIQQQARKKNIEIQTIIPTGLPLLVMDEQRIGQVLINLLSNAVKFTPKGERVCLSVQAQVPPEPSEAFPHGFLRIAVNDTGIGIAPKNMAKLFQPFVQIDSALSRQYEGTGLGLALVKQIVELHEGRVLATSEVGAGSSFMFDLPWPADILAPPALTATPAIAVEETEPQGNTSPLVLLAEDDLANIATISSYLEAKGYRLAVAENGEEAVELARELHPQAILMDIQMPVMNGLEAIEKIRQLGLTDIPIIALTALAMKGDRERCLEAGANEYLSKPVKLKALSALVQRCLTGM